MLSLPLRGVRSLVVCGGMAALLGLAASANADPKPLSKEEQAKVDKAVEKAVAYLKRTQTKEGNWPTKWKDRFLVGECALPAYALLEAGVPANDPVIQKAANFIRQHNSTTDDTYELSLMVLFFGRLGEPKDNALIQTCALRLIAGQYHTGGWSYICPQFKREQELDLLNVLEELDKHLKKEKSVKEFIKEFKLSNRDLIWPHEPPLEIDRRMDFQTFRRRLKPFQLPPKLKGFKGLAVFQEWEKINWREQVNMAKLSFKTLGAQSVPLVGSTDNSNTQFALLALWVAQHHGIPTAPTFRLLVKRFETSQYQNGTWGYGYLNAKKNKLDGLGWPPSMTCVGLLGLAINNGLKLSGLEISQDEQIVMGISALYSRIGIPSGMWDRPVPQNNDYDQDIYFLWSVERICMLFNLPTFGDKEWYRWGAEVLVTSQLETGEFNAVEGYGRNYYGSILKTSFALLFLKHSHPMKDLTPKLTVTVKQLNEGISRLRPSDNHQKPSSSSASQNNKANR